MPRPKGGDPDLPEELARLPHGRHGLPAEFVERNQRQRLIASFLTLLAEQSYAEATIGAITSGAAVSSRTFYKYFETVEDCYLAAFEDVVGRLEPLIVDAYSSQTEWPASIRAAVAVLLQQFTDSPQWARLLSAEPFVAGPAIALRHRELLERIAPYLREGRSQSELGKLLPETTERGLLGSANSLIGRLTFSSPGVDSDFNRLLPDLTQFLLTPYIGAAKAHKLAMSGSEDHTKKT